MSIINTIILGIVEGITEFLPISSTFHLIRASEILGIQETPFLDVFNVFIQSGAIFAVIFLYWKDILFNRKLFTKLILSFIPTAIFGLVFYDVIKSVFFKSDLPTILVFIIIGVLFLIIEKLIDKKKITLSLSISQISYKTAILIGIFQACAIFPGVSRSGAVMLGMMILGFKRYDAAKYSFMLSIPTIFAASFFDLFEMRNIIFSSSSNIRLILIGFFVAMVSAFFVVKWLIKYLQKNSLEVFGWYRIIFGILLLLLLFLK